MIKRMFITLAAIILLAAQIPVQVSIGASEYTPSVASIQKEQREGRQANASKSDLYNGANDLSIALEILKDEMAFNQFHHASGKNTGQVDASYVYSIYYKLVRADATVFEWKLDQRSEHIDNGDAEHYKNRISEVESSFRVIASINDIDPTSIRIEDCGRAAPRMPTQCFKLVMGTYGGKETITFRRFRYISKQVSRAAEATTETNDTEVVSVTNSLAILFGDKARAEGCARVIACAVRLSQHSR